MRRKSVQLAKFIVEFKNRIHSKRHLLDNMRIERFLSVLKGETKKPVESIGKSSIFYAAALKTLKKRFWKCIHSCLYEKQITFR